MQYGTVLLYPGYCTVRSVLDLRAEGVDWYSSRGGAVDWNERRRIHGVVVWKNCNIDLQRLLR